jgi:tetratricopeptide (TPR) repeat protein
MTEPTANSTATNITTAPTLRGKRVAFTGRPATMTRDQAREHVRRLGGEVVDSVSRRTSLLVVGMRGWPILPSGAVSRPLRRAEELASRGSGIRIASEAEFRQIVGLDPRSASDDKAYSADRIATMVGVEPATLRRWEQLSLIRSHDGRYDFRDIVSLRTIADLVARGVRPERIASSLHALSRVLPGTDQPLAQLRIFEGDQSLLVELESGLIDAGGQLRLDFDATQSAARPVAPLAPRPVSADEWLKRGLGHESDERFAEAADAYAEAIRSRRDFAEAHFNRGNALRELDRPEEAASAYRRAVAIDPDMALGWYNLADLDEQQGRVREAIEHLQRALAIDPDFADAHFNLASCYEQLARAGEAAAHWREYVRLDPTSEWARAARERITGQA